MCAPFQPEEITMRCSLCSVVLAVCLLPGDAGQNPPRPPAGASTLHPVYRELRAIGLGTDAYQVSNFVLSKDAATFTLTGTLYMLAPVQEKVTGAVFLGRGTMAYAPPLPVERGMLRNLTTGEDFNETFDRAVFRFTDDTAA